MTDPLELAGAIRAAAERIEVAHDILLRQVDATEPAALRGALADPEEAAAFTGAAEALHQIVGLVEITDIFIRKLGVGAWCEQSDTDEPLSMAQLCKRLMNESELVARVESRRYVTAAELAREFADLIRPRPAQEGIS